jgi:hypothetical protein
MAHMRCLAMMLTAVLLQVAQVRAGEPTRLGCDIGFGGLYRLGEWTPLHITIDRGAFATRQLSVEYRAFQDARWTAISTTLVPGIGNQTSFIVPVLAGNSPNGVVLLREVLDDGKPGFVLDSQDLGKLAVSLNNPQVAGTRLLVVVGDEAAPVPGDFVGSYLPSARLPDRAELLATVDVLVLNDIDPARLTPARRRAIESYARAGGTVVYCLPLTGIEPDPTFAAATWGPIEPITLGKQTLTGRKLTPRDGATAVSPVAVTTQLGLGRLVMVGMPLSNESREVIGEAIGPLATRVVLDSPKVSRPPASTAATVWEVAVPVLLGLMLLIGPVELVVRRTRELAPWRWWTVAGIGGLAAVFVLAPNVDPLPYHMSVTDETGGVVVAHTRFTVGQQGASQVPGLAYAVLPADLSTLGHHPVELTVGARQTTVAAHPFGVLSSTVGPDSPRQSGAVEEILIEEAGGVRTGIRTAAGYVAEGDRKPQLPHEFSAARNLTPRRSAVLQERVTRGQVRIVWLRSGTDFTRVVEPLGR